MVMSIRSSVRRYGKDSGMASKIRKISKINSRKKFRSIFRITIET